MKKQRFLHYSQMRNMESIKKKGLKRPERCAYLYAFKDDEYGMDNILDMLVWRTFGVDNTDILNNKYAAFSSCLVIFECFENDFEIDDGNNIAVIKRDISPDEIISVEKILSTEEEFNLRRILTSFRDNEVREKDLNELLDLKYRIKIEEYPELTDTEFTFMDRKVKEVEDKEEYMKLMAKDLLNDYLNVGYDFSKKIK